MTTTQLAAMRAGREAAAHRRFGEQCDQVRAFREWVALEREAYEQLLETRANGNHDDVSAASDLWHELLGSMPATPPDSSEAWQVA